MNDLNEINRVLSHIIYLPGFLSLSGLMKVHATSQALSLVFFFLGLQEAYVNHAMEYSQQNVPYF